MSLKTVAEVLATCMAPLLLLSHPLLDENPAVGRDNRGQVRWMFKACEDGSYLRLQGRGARRQRDEDCEFIQEKLRLPLPAWLQERLRHHDVDLYGHQQDRVVYFCASVA